MRDRCCCGGSGKSLQCLALLPSRLQHSIVADPRTTTISADTRLLRDRMDGALGHAGAAPWPLRLPLPLRL